MKKGIALVLTAILLSGCANFSSNDNVAQNLSAEQLYEQARNHVRNGEWKSAYRYLSAISNRFPHSAHAQQALIDQAYVSWQDEDAEKALEAIARLQSLYPSHPGNDYILYLKGLITFTPPSAFLSTLTGQNPSERDPKGLSQSYDAFKALVEQYPNSAYAPDARQRLTWLANTIAENETFVAQYYYQRKAYIAAINRSQNVLRDFAGVPVAEKALFILMQSYQALGQTQDAERTQRLLAHNYPNSVYLHGATIQKESWFSRLFRKKS